MTNVSHSASDLSHEVSAQRAKLSIDASAIVLVFARFLLASEFMTYGVRKFLHPENIYRLIEQHHLPGNLVYLVIPWQIGFGWMCFLGLQTRLSATALFGFCIIAPSIFWLNNMSNLTRDYATAGGFLFLFVFGPGLLSLDAGDRRDLVRRLFAPTWRAQPLLDIILLVGRCLMALPFLLDAVRKIADISAAQKVFQSGYLPPSLVFVVFAIELICGLMLLVGYRSRAAAALLAVWSLIQAFTINGVAGWAGLPGATFQTFIYNWFQKSGGTLSSFYKDIEVAGALLIVIVFGPGRIAWSPSSTNPSNGSRP